MMINDLRPLKTELRNKAKDFRRGLSEQAKEELRKKISRNFLSLPEYQKSETVLCYVSTDIEIDTFEIMKTVLADNKKLAVPRCVDGTRLMDFYYINSFDDLMPGAFGVLEPSPDKCQKLEDLSNGLCVVPALLFDKSGFRLGYGKGYYDRYLSKFSGTTVGLAYCKGIKNQLPHGKYDRKTDIIVTEESIYYIGERRNSDYE